MVTQRQGMLLASIIEEFIKTAEPVSSKLLEKSGFFGLSSATIRAEMNDLEERGYLAHIFTSSGRVPTDKAYRYYVDNTINQKSKIKSQKYENIIKGAISEAGDDPREINRVLAQTLSELSENLVIAGIEDEQDFFKVGLSSLFGLPEFREFDRAFRLTSFFDEFEHLFGEMEKEFFGPSSRLPMKKEPASKLKIFIGRENPIRDIRDETVMFAKYNLPHDCAGSLTLIGPTRMDYIKNISLIKCAAAELNKLSREI